MFRTSASLKPAARQMAENIPEEEGRVAAFPPHSAHCYVKQPLHNDLCRVSLRITISRTVKFCGPFRCMASLL